MSIDSTKLAMGYIGFTHSTDRCSVCEHAYQSQAPMHGLRCRSGAFYVNASGTCRRFRHAEPQAAGARTHIGPTDI